MNTIEIPHPPLPLQENYAQVVHRYERLLFQQRESLRQAEGLFQSLLFQSFSDGAPAFDGEL